MRPKTIFIGWMIFMISFCAYCQKQDDFPVVKGPYLGQKPPGLTPEIFAPDVVSTGKNEVNSVFTPDGKEFYFSIFNQGKGYTIMVMKEEEKGWTRPRPAPFSSDYSEVDMFITHDGKQFFFISRRPLKKSGPPSRGYQVWVMNRQNNGWGEAKHLGPLINPGPRQLYPTVTNAGTIYFNSSVKGYGKGDFFRSRYIDGKYTEPENLGDAINTEYDETDVLVAPDESWVIFTSVGRPDGFGSGDLYISFRKKGSWTKAQNMGRQINTNSSEFCPMLSPDRKYFFFTSRRKGSDDIYWVDAKIIEAFKPKRIK